MRWLIITDTDQFERYYEQITGSIYGAAKKPHLDHPVEGQGYVVLDDETQEALALSYVYHDRGFSTTEGNAACFGHFEVKEGATDAVDLLFDLVEKGLPNQYQALIGPMNGSTWNAYRLPTSQVEVPFILDLQQPLYYAAYLAAARFEVLRKYSTNLDHSLDYDQKRAARKKAELSAQKINIRPINLEQFEQELELIYPLCLQSFQYGYLFSPISLDEFVSKYMEIKPYLNPDFVGIAENDDEVCGIVLAIPNLLDRQNKGLIIKTMARKLDPMYQGLGTVLGAYVYEKASAHGISYVVHAFMDDFNTSQRVSEAFSGNRVRTYALFVKKRFLSSQASSLEC